MVIKILGTGCANCQRVKTLAKEVAAELGLAAEVVEVTDIKDIMGYGVMSTPGIVINEKVVGYGGVPSRSQMADLLRQVGG